MALGRVQAVGPEAKTKIKGRKEGGGAMGRKLGTVAGGVIGGIYGGGGGAVAGAQAGGALGGQAGEALKPSSAGTEVMERRAQQVGVQNVQTSDTSNQLQRSLQALAQVDEQTKREFGPQILQAYIKSVGSDNPVA